jgi:hypothetical protein
MASRIFDGDEPLRQAMGHRVWAARSALRHGHGINPHQHARAARPHVVAAFAIALLTLLGAAREALGYDRYLKLNTTKRRTHAVPPGLHALRVDPHHAGVAVAAIDRAVRDDARRTPGLRRYFRGHLKMSHETTGTKSGCEQCRTRRCASKRVFLISSRVANFIKAGGQEPQQAVHMTHRSSVVKRQNAIARGPFHICLIFAP